MKGCVVCMLHIALPHVFVVVPDCISVCISASLYEPACVGVCVCVSV